MYKVITTAHPKHRKYLTDLSYKIISSLGSEHKWLLGVTDKNYGVDLKNELIQSCDDDDIIVFMDADDWPADKNAYEIIKYFMSGPSFDVVYGDCLFRSISDPHKKLSRSKKFDFDSLIEKNYIYHSGTAVRGRIAKLGRWLPLPLGRDWVYWVQLAMHTNKFLYTGNVHAHIRTYTSTRAFRRYNIPLVRKGVRMWGEFLARNTIEEILCSKHY